MKCGVGEVGDFLRAIKSGEDDSSQSTDEDVDLEEGEILDSGEEEEEKKDLADSLLQEALEKNVLKSIEQLVREAKSDITPTNVINKPAPPHNSPHKTKKRLHKYVDQDRFENNSDQEDGWYSPSQKSKSSKFDAKPIDYRKELEAYRGTPPSSPDNKHREKKKRSSKKSKKSSKKTIKRKDIKGARVAKYVKDHHRTKICKFFKEGKCHKGSDCRFSHALPSYKKKELCRFYLSGHCNKESDCNYMHAEFPCKFYHTGSECYAKEKCRFSHAPLTEETKRILDNYLNINRGDDDYDRKRKNSPSPERTPKGPPPKRTCLLGSPPRHIREAEETKRWQEEMLQQQQNHPGFKIHISPTRDGSSPPPFPKPNFYQETLPSTPSPKRKRKEATNNPLPNSFPPPPSSSTDGYPPSNSVEHYSRSSPSDTFVYEEDYLDEEDLNVKQEPPEIAEFSWTNMRAIDPNLPPIIKPKAEPFVDPVQQDLDFTSDVKFDETTQFSEMESSVDCSNVSPPPNPTPETTAILDKESDEEVSDHEILKSDEKSNDDSPPAQEPVVSPIVIPSHLPKKQQELFKRIFQHQKKTEMAVASMSDASNSPKHNDSSEPAPKESEDTKEKSEPEKSGSLWYSSEDDDDDDDIVEPLTNVLKKLQREPPAVNPPVKTESKPAVSIMAMLNKVQQNTQEKKKGTSESTQSDFFKNLLLGTIPSSDSLQLPGLNSSTSEVKRRTLLPDPLAVVKSEPVVPLKDPRLKNRDPRTLANTVNNSLNLPKTLEPTVLSTSSSVTQEVKSTIFSSTSSVISDSVKDVPYKLRGIYTKPPNYTPYITATQSNPNLLKDPRLRKHLNLNPNSENGIEIKKELDSSKTKEVIPIPKLLLSYNKLDSLNINIFEPSPPVSKSAVEENQDGKSFRPKLIDPRMRRRESQNSTGSNTPPHLTIVDNLMPSLTRTATLESEMKVKEGKTWSPPPVLEKSWIPPVLEPAYAVTVKQEVDSDTDDPSRLEIDENPQSSSSLMSTEDTPPVVAKKAPPTPASHLPRAIADPRMARLHDSRRLRSKSSESSNKTIELKKNNSSPSENSADASRTLPSDDAAADPENTKAVKAIPKKKVEKSDEKKKTVHRNRKSSMDYASPLNSCDDSNSSKSLNYNSYNQRPLRSSTVHTTSTDSPVSSSNPTNSIIAESASDFLSDNSNLECDNSNDVNLKDMFKTIDPTASPFC